MKRAGLLLMVLATIGGLAVWLPSASAHSGYAEADLIGRWSFVEEFELGGVYGTATGVYTFYGDGKGQVDFTENGGSSSSRPTSREDVGCAYTLERDGRGTIQCAGLADIAFVITQHGNRIVYISTSVGNIGRGEMARM